MSASKAQVALDLARNPKRLEDGAGSFLGHLVLDLLVEYRRLDRPLLLAERGCHALLHLDDRQRLALSQLERLEHHVFTYFLGARLDHHDRFLAGNGDEIEVGLVALLEGRG